MSSFSIRANREGMSVVCRMPSSVAQAAKAGMKTWWTALTTRSDGSASDSSISSKPWKANAKKWQRCNSRKCWHLGLLYFYSITTAMLFDRQTKTILRNTINTDSVLSTHTPGNICQGRQCTPWWFPDSWSQPPWPCQLCPQRASAAAWTTPRSYGFPSAEKKLAFCFPHNDLCTTFNSLWTYSLTGRYGARAPQASATNSLLSGYLWLIFRGREQYLEREKR